jgi:hypothetical protein
MSFFVPHLKNEGYRVAAPLWRRLLTYNPHLSLARASLYHATLAYRTNEWSHRIYPCTIWTECEVLIRFDPALLLFTLFCAALYLFRHLPLGRFGH